MRFLTPLIFASLAGVGNTGSLASSNSQEIAPGGFDDSLRKLSITVPARTIDCANPPSTTLSTIALDTLDVRAYVA